MKWLPVLLAFVVDFLLWITAVEGDNKSWLKSIVTTFTSEETVPHRRSKRSLIDFETVIQCYQPWAQVLPVYGDYGCYCGVGGQGRPLDDTDKCCFLHDKCYEVAVAEAKTWSEWAWGSYFTPYTFDCLNNTAICREDANTPYQQLFCECDRDAAECFLRNRKTYSNKLYDINTAKYCQENSAFDDFSLNIHTLSKLYTCDLQLDQDRCCVDKGYNSVYSMCCDGELWDFPKHQRQHFQCCSKQMYDVRKHQCCYGVLHRNVDHFQCCGTEGAKVDLTIARCVDGQQIPFGGANLTSNSTRAS